MVAGMNELEAPARIEVELLAAFRKQKFARPKYSAIYSVIYSVIQARRYWAAAAAAVLLVVVGLAAMQLRPGPAPVATQNPDIPIPQPSMNYPNNGAASPGVDSTPAVLPVQETTLVSRKPRRPASSLLAQSKFAGKRANTLKANRDTTVAANYEVATDFLPLGYASPMNLQDGGQVMRVELPRSALARFGLPVNMERVNERVKADVLVGSDGQARAIRFVQ
jgi:hypothetical protein